MHSWTLCCSVPEKKEATQNDLNVKSGLKKKVVSKVTRLSSKASPVKTGVTTKPEKTIVEEKPSEVIICSN